MDSNDISAQILKAEAELTKLKALKEEQKLAAQESKFKHLESIMYTKIRIKGDSRIRYYKSRDDYNTDKPFLTLNITGPSNTIIDGLLSKLRDLSENKPVNSVEKRSSCRAIAEKYNIPLWAVYSSAHRKKHGIFLPNYSDAYVYIHKLPMKNFKSFHHELDRHLGII